MFLPPGTVLEGPGDSPGFDEAIARTPSGPAVFLAWPASGAPYLAKTASLRRRLTRLLRKREAPSRMLNLRAVVSRVEFWPTASRLESSLFAYELARRHFPETYLELLKLRMPPYIKLLLSKTFPRTQITSRLGGAGVFFGPFRARAGAERFESEFLDLFQIRRCQDDFEPSPEHPGCIYGEMNRCLRPCQLVVGVPEYQSEVERVAHFLSSRGESLVRSIAASRDRFSEEMEFEEAARQHARLERVQQVVRLGDELASDIDRLRGVAVTPSTEPSAVTLWFFERGFWLPPLPFPLMGPEGRPLSMDRRLREVACGLQPRKLTLAERQEHLAMLARWYYSSWRDGEWLSFDGGEAIPYRKLVNAIHRVARSPLVD
ncbi:MAG: hypothetical protein KIT09_26380 [Bryobacteraceae bacterium]|nr:hypothetical protein [Bryobacteraceae bacterium]